MTLPDLKKASAIVLLLLSAWSVSVAMALPGGPVVGQVAMVLGDVSGTDQDGDTFEVVRGGDVHAGYTFQTGSRAFIRVEMNDGTRLTLGRNGEATVEGFSFDPAARRGEFKARIALGGFRYASGQIGTFSNRRDHTTLSTPSAVIGIRGSEMDGVVDANGRTTAILRSGRANVVTNSGRSATLTDNGNTAETDVDGDVDFTPQPTPQQQQRVDSSLPTQAEESQADSAGGEEAEEEQEQEQEQEEEAASDEQSEGDAGVDSTETTPADQPAATPTDGSDSADGADGGTGSGGGGGGTPQVPGSPSGAAPVS